MCRPFRDCDSQCLCCLVSQVFGESWEDKQDRLRASSEFASHPGWSLTSVIIKTHDDLRQEEFALQVVLRFKEIFADAKLKPWLSDYRIFSTSSSAGLIEVVPDAISIDGLKKKLPANMTLAQFMPLYFGGQACSHAVCI